MKYIILKCDRDKVWLVSRKSNSKPYYYYTVAECFDEEVADMLLAELIKKEQDNEQI